MTTYRFQPVRATATRRVTCPGCGKKRNVQRTFSQTVNPFNKNDDGSVKTHSEVSHAVVLQARAWEPAVLDLWHYTCWEAAR